MSKLVTRVYGKLELKSCHKTRGKSVNIVKQNECDMNCCPHKELCHFYAGIRVCFLFSHKKLLVFCFTVILWKLLAECKRQMQCFLLRAMNSISEECMLCNLSINETL